MTHQPPAQATPPVEDPRDSPVLSDIDPHLLEEELIPPPDSPDADPAPARRRRPRPVLILGLLGGVILGALGYLAIGRLTMPLAENQAHLEPRPPAALVPVPPLPASVEESSLTPPASEKNAPAADDLPPWAPPAMTTPPNPDGNRQALWQRLDTLVTRLDEAVTRQPTPDALNDQAKATLDRMEALLAQQTAVVEQLVAVTASWETRIDSVEQPPSLPTETAQGGPAGRPPFRLEAIDVWDGVNQVTLSQAGQRTFLQTGDRQAGWTVIRIDPLVRQVEWTDPHGQSHTFSLP